MKLWLLIAQPDHEYWRPWYDKAFAFVVRAETEEEARRIAQDNGGDEIAGGAAWTEAATCEELAADGEAGVIIQDFAAA